MRCCVSFLVLVLAVALSTNAQQFGNANFEQNYPLYPYYEENDLQTDQYFYFDIDLLKVIAEDQEKGNILISPLSIKSVLAMILEGAKNESAQELRNVLRLPNNRRVREQFKKLLAEFQRPKRAVTLEMANRVFVSKKLSPLVEYENILAEYYNSNVTKVDFQNPVQSANMINSWANENTHGIIPMIVNSANFGGDVSILLANVLYFKGQWEKAFSETGTKNHCFYLLPTGECQLTPMMDVVDNFKYEEVKRLDAKFLELPYSGREYSMIIAMPNNRHGILQLSRDIVRASINSIVQNLTETEVFVTLPRFKIDYNIDLVNYLPKVHVKNILSPNAQLNGIVADVSMRVSNVIHQTSIEVNEQGTIAAAATAAVVIPLMGTTKPRFKADHPFLFFIRHSATGTILFEGRLSVPEKAQENHQQGNRHQANQQNHQQGNVQQNNQQNAQQGNTLQHNQPNPQQENRQQHRPQVQPQASLRPTQPQPGFSNVQHNPNVNPVYTSPPQAQSQPNQNNPQSIFEAQSSQPDFVVDQPRVTFQNPAPINYHFSQPAIMLDKLNKHIMHRSQPQQSVNSNVNTLPVSQDTAIYFDEPNKPLQ